MPTVVSAVSDSQTYCVLGAQSAIGNAWVQALAARPEVGTVHAFSRSGRAFEHPKVQPGTADVTDEESLRAAAEAVGVQVDGVLVATGILHEGDSVQPERSVRHLEEQALVRVLQVNTVGPTLVLKHFAPLLPRDRRCVVAALSARIGSISDNRLGGWYAYRASKAALNMILRTASIELKRRYPLSLVVGLHPGTVDSPLSLPFQSSVPEGKLFTPEYSANALLQVLDRLTPEDSGGCYAWDGSRIEP